MDTNMRALRLFKRAGPDAIVFEHDVARPAPGIGDVLVRVDAASLTPTELAWPSTWVDRAGADRLPVIPAHEVCGDRLLMLRAARRRLFHRDIPKRLVKRPQLARREIEDVCGKTSCTGARFNHGELRGAAQHLPHLRKLPRK